MQNHIRSRLIIEKEQLITYIDSLGEHMSSDHLRNHSLDEMRLLCEQMDTMRRYLAILNERLSDVQS